MTGRLSALAVGLIVLASSVPARADQALSTEITSSGSSPVRIDGCRAVLMDRVGANSWIPAVAKANRDYYLDTAVDFTNVSPQRLNAVRFLFDVQDTFGVVTQSVGLDWTGTFTPNAAIHARRNLAGAVGTTNQQNTASTPTRVVCHVQFARYDDGRVWKEGDRTAPVAPGLYYPTPYPSTSPRVRADVQH